MTVWMKSKESEESAMKKKVVMLLMSAMLMATMLLAGCGKSEPTVTTRVVSPTPTAIPTQTPTPTPEPTEEPTVEPTAEPTAEPTETVSEDTVAIKYEAPDGYEDYTYGSAPLSSVYLLIAYSYAFDEEAGETIENVGLTGLTPEQFMLAIDQELGILPADDEEQTEAERKFGLCMLLGLSGVAGTNEQVDGFFDGTWIPDGVDYYEDMRDEDGSVHWN